MKKIAVVYWSGTGNTEKMAYAVADGAKSLGADVYVMTPAEFDPDTLASYDAVGFGCPAMGDGVLEESEFAPMFDACRGKLSGKRVGLFGSYGWGDGEWMRSWESDCISLGAKLVGDSVICNEAPDDAALADCRALGAALSA